MEKKGKKRYRNNSIALSHSKIVSEITNGFVKDVTAKNVQKEWLLALEQGKRKGNHSAIISEKKENSHKIVFSNEIDGTGRFSMRTYHHSDVTLLKTKMGINIPVMPVGRSSMFNNNLVIWGNAALNKKHELTVKATAIIVNGEKKFTKDSWEFSVKSKPKRGRDANMSVVKYSASWLTDKFNRDKFAPTWRTAGCILVISIADQQQVEHSLALVIGKPKPKKRKVNNVYSVHIYFCPSSCSMPSKLNSDLQNRCNHHVGSKGNMDQVFLVAKSTRLREGLSPKRSVKGSLEEYTAACK